MSVFIKNMEMPQNCNECDLSRRRHSSIGDIIDCKRIGTVGSMLNDPYMILINRHPDCPLVEMSFSKEQMKIVDEMLKERGRRMKEFMSEHWVILYGLLLFVLGEIAGYIKGKR